MNPSGFIRPIVNSGKNKVDTPIDTNNRTSCFSLMPAKAEGINAKTTNAISKGLFKDEIVPITLDDVYLDEKEKQKTKTDRRFASICL